MVMIGPSIKMFTPNVMHLFITHGTYRHIMPYRYFLEKLFGTLPLKALLAEFALFVMPLNWFGFFPAKGLIIGQRTARRQPVFFGPFGDSFYLP